MVERGGRWLVAMVSLEIEWARAGAGPQPLGGQKVGRHQRS